MQIGQIVTGFFYGKEERYKIIGLSRSKKIVFVQNLKSGLRTWKHVESLTEDENADRLQ